jgi:hypothetical protein
MSNKRRQGVLEISLQDLKEILSLSDETRVLNVYRDTNDILSDTYKVLVENPDLPLVSDIGQVPVIDYAAVAVAKKICEETEEEKTLREQQDMLCKNIITCSKNLIIAVMGRQSGKTTIIKTLIGKDNVYCILSSNYLAEWFKKRVDSSLHGKILSRKMITQKNFGCEWRDKILVIDEIDYTDITVSHIEDLFRRGLKQCFVLGTPKSLEARVMPKYVNEEPTLTIEYSSTLLSLYFRPPAHPSIGRFFSPAFVTKNDRENFRKVFIPEEYQRDILLP